MSRKRLGRMQRVATIIPLALVSGVWTANVASMGGLPSPALAAEQGTGLIDGTSVPSDPIEEPASLSNPGSIEGLEDGNDADIINAASTDQIPSAALAAYQRAESVINSADKSCKLTWQLVAAIGRVESNHGRTDGNVLDDDGIATPGIYGDALDGKKGAPEIADTDGGQFDNDERWDRQVGPMQFIPSTWSVVGVDADGDGQRNPQDVDDAALATAVYLCSGPDDLSTLAGQQDSVYRYNNSDAYVDLVLKIMNLYLEGDYTTAPNNSTAAGYLLPGDDSVFGDGGYDPGGRDSDGVFDSGNNGGDGGDTTDNNDGGTTDDGDNNDGGTTDDGDGDGDGGIDTGGDPSGTANDLSEKVKDTVKDTVDTVDEGVGDVTSNLISGVLGLLAKEDAAAACQSAYPKLTQTVQLLNCLVSYGLG